MIWRGRGRDVELSHVAVMGVLNVTPDSFSDGGRYVEPDSAVSHGRAMIAAGAAIVDVGAESTRPGSAAVPPAEQLRRLLPVVQTLAAEGAALSVDTASAEVARESLAAGAAFVNDVTALGDPAMATVVAESGAGLALMHMQGTPATMQADPHYAEVTKDVRVYLEERVAFATRMGIAAERLAIDPGIGFGKTIAHNLELLARLDELAPLGLPVLVGVSRKGFLGRLTGGAPPDDRLEAGLAAAAIAVFRGAAMIRTHDVAATVRAVRVAEAIAAAGRMVPGPARR